MYIRTNVRTSLNVDCVAVRGYSVCLQCLRSHSVKVKIAMIVFYSNAACYHNRQTPFEETLCAFDLFSVFCTFNTFKWAHFIDLYVFWFYSLRGDYGVSILSTQSQYALPRLRLQLLLLLCLQLAYCVVQFLEKDATLTEPVRPPLILLPQPYIACSTSKIRVVNISQRFSRKVWCTRVNVLYRL